MLFYAEVEFCSIPITTVDWIEFWINLYINFGISKCGEWIIIVECWETASSSGATWHVYMNFLEGMERWDVFKEIVTVNTMTILHVNTLYTGCIKKSKTILKLLLIPQFCSWNVIFDMYGLLEFLNYGKYKIIWK
jgi:hypothetical protein